MEKGKRKEPPSLKTFQANSLETIFKWLLLITVNEIPQNFPFVAFGSYVSDNWWAEWDYLLERKQITIFG